MLNSVYILDTEIEDINYEWSDSNIKVCSSPYNSVFQIEIDILHIIDSGKVVDLNRGNKKS